MGGIEADRLAPKIMEAVLECLETMVGRSDGKAWDEGDNVASSSDFASYLAFIGFASGFAGALSIHAPESVAREIAAGLLALDDASEVEDDDLKDAFGEFANMVAGGMKTRCEADDIHFALSTPMVMATPCQVVPHYPGATVAKVGISACGGIIEAEACLQPLKD